MSSSGQTSQATNIQLYGGTTGYATNVTQGGNLGAQMDYDLVNNIGKLILRTDQPTRLQDIPCVQVIVYSPASNGNIWYAGYGDQQPQVGVGTPILPGETETIACSDSNILSFIPEVDGNPIYVLVQSNNSNAVVTPGNPPALDTTPPTLSAFQPNVNPATNFGIFTPIIVKASEALDPNTVNNSTVTCTPTLVGTIGLSSSDPTEIIVTPTANLSFSTTYTLTYNTGIADLAGNHLASSLNFVITTIPNPGGGGPPPDTTPPTIISGNPGDGSQNVNTSTTPSIVFSEAILGSSINANNIVAYIMNNNQQILNLGFSQSVDLTTIYVGNMNLASSMEYSITVYGGNGFGPTDLSGNYLQTNSITRFTTAAPASIMIYNVGGNSYDNLTGTNRLIISGVLVNSNRSKLVNQIPVSYTFIIHKSGSPSGNVSFLWYRIDNSGNYNVFRTLGTITAASVTTTDQVVTIQDTGNTSGIQNNDLICVQYSNGNTSNYISVKVSSYDAYDGSSTCSGRVTSQNSTLIEATNADMAGTISIAGATQ